MTKPPEPVLRLEVFASKDDEDDLWIDLESKGLEPKSFVLTDSDRAEILCVAMKDLVQRWGDLLDIELYVQDEKEP